MRYLSLFSGIEAATVAWKPLGWEAVSYAEIDKFPSQVLAQHYPDTPNFGDVANLNVFQLDKLGQIDLIIFGSPCQDLSVAGKGAGLNGERSGLFRAAMLIADHCIKHNGTRFVLWENVPGAYSSNKGADFSEVVGSMAGLSDVEVPAYGWGKEGVALGHKGLLEWSCLDAQFFGLAQRRKRVFALLDTGDWAGRPPVLLERESLRGDSEPSREAGSVTAALTANGVGTCGADDNQAQAGHLIAGAHRMTAFGQYETDETASTMKARDYKDATDLVVVHGTQDPIPSRNTAHCLGRNNGQEHVIGYIDNENSAVSPYKPLGTLMAGSPSGGGRPLPAVAYGLVGNIIGRNDTAGGNGTGVQEELSYTLSTTDRHCTVYNTHVRRLTPKECERLQGFPDDYTVILSNSQRYRALGNSMAVPVIQYIGLQIQMAMNYQLEQT